jgi:hypothetical protein
MKSKLKKLPIVISLLIFLCSLFVVFEAQADYEIEVTIPGGPTEGTAVSLTDYIRDIYLFGLAIVGLAALGALVYGGFTYMLSETITTKEDAKKWIWGALSGLVLGLAAYLILNTINPDLVSLRAPCREGNCPDRCATACEPPYSWSSVKCQCVAP